MNSFTNMSSFCTRLSVRHWGQHWLCGTCYTADTFEPCGQFTLLWLNKWQATPALTLKLGFILIVRTLRNSCSRCFPLWWESRSVAISDRPISALVSRRECVWNLELAYFISGLWEFSVSSVPRNHRSASNAVSSAVFTCQSQTYFLFGLDGHWTIVPAALNRLTPQGN